MAYHAIEQVAVDHQQAAAVGHGVDHLVGHLDAAEIQIEVVAQRLVMIARYIHHLRTLARLAQQLLHHIVMRLRPVPAFLQAPGVDDVAHQIEGFGFVLAQKIQQVLRLAAGGAKMKIGDPDAAIRCMKILGQVGRSHWG